MTEPTDAEIVARSLTRDPEAFGEIFDRHVQAIHSYLARRDQLNADNLVGEVFRVAFEARHRYQMDRLCALPWLYGIAANVLRQHGRSERRQVRLTERLSGIRPPTPGSLGPEESVVHDEEVALALAALDLLPEADRDALMLFTWEELSYEEIAVALQIPLGTVRSRLHRARARVREHLAVAGQEVSEERRQPDRRCS